MAATSLPEYSESSIRVLKGLEPVKQRPDLYTRTESPLHIVQEVIDNAADDGGRGIPFGLHPEEDVAVPEIVFTRLHAGGKFDKGAGGAYCFSGGDVIESEDRLFKRPFPFPMAPRNTTEHDTWRA